MKYSLYNEDPVIRTFSGKWFNAFDLKPEMICIEDIAHALSHQCRFGGHLPKFYSVAQHSVLTSTLVSDEHKLAALLHDASEAYLLDIPRPITKHLSNYAEIEDSVMRIIAAKYCFQWPLHDDVKKADEIMLQKEWDEIMIGRVTDVVCLTPKYANEFFMNAFNNLYDQAGIL